MSANPQNISKPGTVTGSQASQTAPLVPPVPDFIDLPRGTSLSEIEAATLAGSRPVRLIVIAGPVGSGKTTLITSLYELLQWSSVADYSFAGSNTLPGFEQRCHLARLDSDLPVPETQRSQYKENDAEYLHLRVASPAPNSRFTDFLFTDVSGEMFEYASNSIEGCKELKFLRRATDLVLLLDGEKCVSSKVRHAFIQKVKTLIQSFLDSEMIDRMCAVNCIWTKADYFTSPRGDSVAFRAGVVADFLKTFGGRIPFMKFSEVAARPTTAPQLGFGYGVADLLKGWMTLRPQERHMTLRYDARRGNRESERFGIAQDSSTRHL